MRAWRWSLGVYLMLAWLGCLLVYLGADTNVLGPEDKNWIAEHAGYLFWMIPLSIVAVIFWVGMEGSNGDILLFLAGLALVEVVILYALGLLIRLAIKGSPLAGRRHLRVVHTSSRHENPAPRPSTISEG